MTTDPRIEAAAKAMRDHGRNAGAWCWHEVSEDTRERYRSEARAALAAADKAAIITTEAELVETPAGTVFIDSYRAHLGGDVYSKSILVNPDGETSHVYWQAGPQGAFTTVQLPARVIHWGQS